MALIGDVWRKWLEPWADLAGGELFVCLSFLQAECTRRVESAGI
jgi:hypothetical protein